MNGFAPTSTALNASPSDPTKHVNYVLGMVLGEDDFKQEHAYLSERDRWLVRDLVGYGTAWGLKVTAAMGARGPEIRVAPGVAVSPRGQLIRVTPEQCAALNDWLVSHASALGGRVQTPSGEAPFVQLYVTAGYGACATDNVPIPGEPCRTEDDAVSPSRVTDDFSLELRFDPPDQREEDAVRDFSGWLLQHLEIARDRAAGISMDDFLQNIRDAVVPLPSVGPPTDYLDDTRPAARMKVFADDLFIYVRAAFRLWATELRAKWRTNWLGEAHSCAGPLQPGTGEDGLLLAAVKVPLTRDLGSSQWQVASAPEQVVVDESTRPFLASVRQLQELSFMLAEAVAAATAPPPVQLVAAGRVSGAGVSAPSFNNLRVVDVADGKVFLSFNGFQVPSAAGRQYVVKAMPEGLAVARPAVSFGGYRAATGTAEAAIVLNVLDDGAPVPKATLTTVPLMVEVTSYGAGA